MPNEDSWTATFVTAATPLKEVIANLNASGLQIALVVDDKRNLLGTITDGDIRRALLRGIDLEGEARAIMCDRPKTLPVGIAHEIARREMAEARIFQIPALGVEGTVAGLYLWDEVVQTPDRGNLVVIMAGGFGKRLRPLTDHCPKPMLPLNGRPILEHLIERLKGEGFSRFVLSLHYLGEVIEDHFEDGARFDVEVSYLRETTPLGTAGALSLLELDEKEPIMVTNGDVLSDISYGAMVDWHQAKGATASMAVRAHRIQNPFGVVKLEGNEIIGFEEKPVYHSHVNAGIYSLNPEALKQMERGAHCDMPNLFERLQKAGQRTCAFPMHEDWIDLGRLEDLERAETLSKDSAG